MKDMTCFVKKVDSKEVYSTGFKAVTLTLDDGRVICLPFCKNLLCGRVRIFKVPSWLEEVWDMEFVDVS